MYCIYIIIFSSFNHSFFQKTFFELLMLHTNITYNMVRNQSFFNHTSSFKKDLLQSSLKTAKRQSLELSHEN